jgi:hypothetical protein
VEMRCLVHVFGGTLLGLRVQKFRAMMEMELFLAGSASETRASRDDESIDCFASATAGFCSVYYYYSCIALLSFQLTFGLGSSSIVV